MLEKISWTLSFSEVYNDEYNPLFKSSLEVALPLSELRTMMVSLEPLEKQPEYEW